MSKKPVEPNEEVETEEPVTEKPVGEHCDYCGGDGQDYPGHTCPECQGKGVK